VRTVSVRRFEHQAGGIEWYCEQRGDGPPVVLVPSGEGDCASFDKVAAQLAKNFTVLTFDAPGFSRGHVRTADDVSVSKLADQIACLVESLETPPATFYGCSSGGFAVLDLVVRHSDLVRNAVVHAVANARGSCTTGRPHDIRRCRHRRTLPISVRTHDERRSRRLGSARRRVSRPTSEELRNIGPPISGARPTVTTRQKTSRASRSPGQSEVSLQPSPFSTTSYSPSNPAAPSVHCCANTSPRSVHQRCWLRIFGKVPSPTKGWEPANCAD
jgi:pimeloyl-ACP methyl ester carboxylesterase